MMHREVIDVCCEIRKKHQNMLCGHNTEFLMLKRAVRTVSSNYSALKVSCNVLNYTIMQT
jgi:hypothetical protein